MKPRRPDGPPGTASDLPQRLDRIHQPYVPLSRRRRVLIALLAATTAITLLLLMLYPPGGVQRKRPTAPADVPACSPGQTDGCVGSPSQVLPAAPAADTAATPSIPSR